jgi:CheY-like chemotaxis protein
MVKDCLLIEDDLDDQEIFMMALQKINAEISCTIANDGIEGLNKLSDPDYRPELICIDINMPKITGLECLENIKKLSHLRNSRIVMYSTSQDKAIMVKCKELGADHFIVKPPGFTPLVESLTTILKG